MTTKTVGGTSERTQRDGRAWRELAAMAIQALGLQAQPRMVYRRKSGAPEEVSDIIGPNFDQWMIRTRLRVADKLSMALDDAEARAKAAKRPFAAVIHRRNSRDPRDAYVTMTLATFAGFIKSQEQAVQNEAAKLRLKAATPPHRLP